jgi:hypothetical protein
MEKLMTSPITAIGPHLSPAATERLSDRFYRPKAKDDAPDAEAANLSGINQALLDALPGGGLERLAGTLTSPPPGGEDPASFIRDMYEEDVWPAVVINAEDLPQVGFPKGIAADVVAKQRENAQKAYDAARDAQKKAQEEEEARRKAEEENRPHGTGGGDDPGDPPDMPNPDSGDPGGPRTLDPFNFQVQLSAVKAIVETAIR